MPHHKKKKKGQDCNHQIPTALLIDESYEHIQIYTGIYNSVYCLPATNHHKEECWISKSQTPTGTALSALSFDKWSPKWTLVWICASQTSLIGLYSIHISLPILWAYKQVVYIFLPSLNPHSWENRLSTFVSVTYNRPRSMTFENEQFYQSFTPGVDQTKVKLSDCCRIVVYTVRQCQTTLSDLSDCCLQHEKTTFHT